MAKSSSEKPYIIKVNPYENSENVMELMANICSATPSVDTDVYWKIINDAYNKEIRGKSLSKYLDEQRYNLLNGDFAHNLLDYCRQLSWSLTSRENTSHTQIVVAGGFSSGKSSFLNRITDSTNLLPTGTEPVSVVKTYLYCSNNAKSVVVKGVNQKNVLVNLDTSVLQAIQHANKSNIYLASVLDDLFVEIPSTNLDGLVFIDTPGYNNSDKENKSNGKTDKETALEAMAEGNVLFWFIGSDRPTITEDDKEIIRKFNGRKVIIFNKADKIGKAESKKVVEHGAQVIFNEFDASDIIDIIAYSSLDKKVYFSYYGKSIEMIVDEAKQSGNGMSDMNQLKSSIESLFDNEINASKNAIKEIEKGYKQELKKKDKFYNYYNSAKDEEQSIIQRLKEIVIDNYEDVTDVLEQINEAGEEVKENFEEFIDEVERWDERDHNCFDNTLKPILNRYKRIYNKVSDNFDEAYDYTYKNSDERKQLVNDLKKKLKDLSACKKDLYDQICAACSESIERKEKESNLIKDFTDYKQVFMQAIELGIQKYQKQNVAVDFSSEDAELPNIFESIKNDNFKAFLRAFEDGIDMSVCNVDGYNPLTLAVEQGNNAMVQFMLKNGAKPDKADCRGYNAFHTAVENQYRDICKILLDNDPDLINSKTSQGEDVEELANKSTFVKWIKNEIDNAF